MKAAKRPGESEEQACKCVLEKIDEERGASATSIPESSVADELGVFLASLGLAHLEPRFVEEDLELSVMQSLSPDGLKQCLTDLGLPIGIRLKICTGLETKSKAAKKAAEIKAADAQFDAAVARDERDGLRIKALREQIKKLEHVMKQRRMPDAIQCPITHDVMVDPVTAADGRSYERHAIEAWFRKHNTSPFTGEVLKDRTLLPSYNMRDIVQSFLAECREAGIDIHS